MSNTVEVIYSPTTSQNTNGLVEMLRMDKSIGQKRVLNFIIRFLHCMVRQC